MSGFLMCRGARDDAQFAAIVSQPLNHHLPPPPPAPPPFLPLCTAVVPLLQHYSLRKAASYRDPLASKEPLLLVNGLRSFLARPIYSTDEHGADKHKMERFLHEGRWGGGRW